MRYTMTSMAGLLKKLRFTPKQTAFFLVIFALFAFTRFVNLHLLLIFDWDQEQFSNQILKIIKHGDFTLLGPRANNDLGFFLAPYFTYILLPWYYVANLNPYVLLPFLVTFNIFFYFTSFFIIRKLFSTAHALWFLFFWTLNFMFQNYDQIPWWPLFIPLGVLSVWYFLQKIYTVPKDTKNWVFLGFALGFFFNMHFQFIFLTLFSIIFLTILLIKHRYALKNSIGSIGGFVVTFTPLLIFDLRNSFLNSKLFFQFFFGELGGEAKDVNVWYWVFGHFIEPYTHSELLVPVPIFYIIILLFFIVLSRSKAQFYTFFYHAALSLWLIFPLFYMFWGKRPSEYYFMFLAPFIIIAITDFFLTIKYNFLLSIVAILIILINTPRIYTRSFEINPVGLYHKQQVVQQIYKRLNDKKFNVSFDGAPNTATGFQYLFEVKGVKQTGNWTDPLVQVREPPQPGDITIGRYGILLPPQYKGL